MSEYRLHQATDALLAVLKEYVPEVPWVEKVQGPQYPKELAGTVTCGSLEFEYVTKQDAVGTATYNITIISPNVDKTFNDPRYLEALALKVQQVLSEDYSLHNWVDDSEVTKIIWGSAAGAAGVGMAVLTYVVKIGMNDD